MIRGVIRRLGAMLLLCWAVGVPAQEAQPLTPRVDETGVVWSAGPYAYDGAGNIKAIGSETFVYDRLGRLVSGTAGTGRLQEYTYDAFGNILSVTTDGSTGAALKPCVDPATNRINRNGTDCNAVGTYDLAGNMIAYGSYATFQYDELNVVKASTVDGVQKVHLYNANDERIASITVVGGQKTSSDWTIRDKDGRTLRRFHRTAAGEWSWTEDYIYREGALLAAEVSGPERTRHFHLDHLGTPRLITGSGGAELARHTYYPFGREATNPAQNTERAKFTGHERDDANLDYMHARYYLPYTGRFLSVDPIMPVEAMRSPQLWNRYSYVGNNPMNRIDPTGKILQFFGSTADLEKVKAIANSGLHGYKLNINDKGVASLEKVKVKGAETSEQKALRGALQQVIGDKGTTSINVASGAKGVVIGQFNMKTIDPTDMQKFGSAQPSAASTLGHEVLEQYAGQVGNIAMAAAHAWASQKESALTGWTRGGQTPTKWLPNGQAYSDVRYTRGNESMDVRVTVNPATFDVTSVTRIPVP